jgi:hypothetical protein
MLLSVVVPFSNYTLFDYEPTIAPSSATPSVRGIAFTALSMRWR